MHFYFDVSISVILITRGRHTFNTLSLITIEKIIEAAAGKHLHRKTNNIRT